jgi:hypothetical protein
VGLIQVSLRPFRAEPFIGRFPGLKPRAESPEPLRGIRTSPKSAYLSAILTCPFLLSARVRLQNGANDQRRLVASS